MGFPTHTHRAEAHEERCESTIKIDGKIYICESMKNHEWRFGKSHKAGVWQRVSEDGKEYSMDVYWED